MADINWPPLPEPCRTAAVENFQGASEYRSLSSDYETHTARFSINQLRARDLAVAQAVRDACERACVAQASRFLTSQRDIYVAHECVAAIRAIKLEVPNADR